MEERKTNIESLTSHNFGEFGSYHDAMDKVTEKELLRLTTAQIFSLIDSSPNYWDEDILVKLRNEGIWTATESLWGEKDVIVYDNVNGEMPANRKGLLKKYEEGDKAVRVVPYQFFHKRGTFYHYFCGNPYMLAQVGDENMLEVVDRVVRKINRGRFSENLSYVCTPSPQDSRGYLTHCSLINDWREHGLILNDPNNYGRHWALGVNR